MSLPIRIADLRDGPWFETEDRLFKEYDRVREVSLKLLFGSQEKLKRIGHGEMEEPVFTVGPFKDSRVKLSKRLDGGPERDSTFYNASWIGKEFIAAAMPQTARAREAFWRLIWEYDVPTIVMLNEDTEGAHRHHDIQRYCPNVLNEWEAYGEMQVLKAEQVTARNMSATVRKLRIRCAAEPDVTKEVNHVQYRDWPDGGIPSDRDDYKEFISYLLNLSRSLREGDGGPVLVHCLGADHEILTSEGFMGIAALESRWNVLEQRFSAGLKIATVEPRSKQLHYEDASQLVVNAASANDELIEFGSISGLGLRVTPGHDMYVELSGAGYRKMTAQSLWEVGQQQAIMADILLHVPQGYRPEDFDWRTLEPTVALKLDSYEQVNAFVSMYGFWIDSNRLESSGCSDALCASEKEMQWLKQQFLVLGLTAGTDYREAKSVGGETSIHFVHALWRDVFCGIQREALLGSGDGVAAWVWRLDCELMRALLLGARVSSVRNHCKEERGETDAKRLRVAQSVSEDEESEEMGRPEQSPSAVAQFVTSLPRLRDDLVRVALHAGCGARFEACSKGEKMGWKVLISDHSASVASVNLSQLRRVPNTDRTFCVTVPNGTIVARRVIQSNRSVSASAVVGNCFGGRGRTGVTIAALLELKKIEQFAVDEIDICGTVSEMRTFRSLLVETLEQYKFIFWVVLALIDSLPKPSTQ